MTEYSTYGDIFGILECCTKFLLGVVIRSFPGSADIEKVQITLKGNANKFGKCPIAIV